MNKTAKPPPVNLVLQSEPLRQWRERIDHGLLVDHIRQQIDTSESFHASVNDAATQVGSAVADRVRKFALEARAKVNATGIVIHTGWGNAPLHAEAVSRVVDAAGATDTGGKDGQSRTRQCTELLLELTGSGSCNSD